LGWQLHCHPNVVALDACAVKQGNQSPSTPSRYVVGFDFTKLVRDGGSLDSEEQGLVFGESLPKGLRLA